MNQTRNLAVCCFFSISAFLINFQEISAEEILGKPLAYDITKNLKLELPGYYRFRFTHLGSMDLAKIPTGSREGYTQSLEPIDYTEHRFRIEPTLTFFKKLSFHSQIDILTGMLSGDTDGRPYLWYAEPEQRWNQIDGGQTLGFQNRHFKRYWGKWEMPIGLIQVGRQGSNWGLGILANDGDGFKNDFGDSYYGDNVDRVLFGTKPYSIFQYLFSGQKPEKDPVTIAFAYDWHVARDAFMKRGKEKLEAKFEEPVDEIYGDLDDKVHQYIGAILVETEPFEGGFYIVRRIMDHPDVLVSINNQPPGGEYLRAWIFDVYGRYHAKPSFLNGGEVFLEGELARVVGETNLTVSQIVQSPENPFPESDVSQLGWVIRGGVRQSFIEASIEVGYASGDSHAFDTEAKNFKFHPDFNVGMILFEDLWGNVSAASAYNAVNQFGEAGPVKTLGADLLPTNGSVTNAVYLKPTVKLSLYKNLDCLLSTLLARTATDVVDPTIDGLFGGGAGIYNPYGAPSDNHYLGLEIDFGIQYKLEWRYLDSLLGVQYGHLFPGDVFEDRYGTRIDDIDKVQVRITMLW